MLFRLPQAVKIPEAVWPLDVEVVGKWMAVAATVGGMAGGVASKLIDLWWKAHEGDDKIKVGFDTMRPEATPTTSMHVVNLTSHKIKLADYGFVYRHGFLLSLPWTWEVDTPDEHEQPHIRGSTEMEKRGDYYEVGVYFNVERPIGCYAITTASDKLFLGWRYDTNIIDRTWARVCLMVKKRWK